MTEMEQKITDIIEEHLYMKRINSDNEELSYFIAEIDNRDFEYSKSNISKIINSANPEETAWDIAQDAMVGQEIDDRDWLEDEILKHLEKEYEETEIDLMEEVREFSLNYISLNWKYDPMEQEICINVTTDFYGEANYDFTKNEYSTETGKLKRGSVLWLLHSQGYKVADLYNEEKRNNSIFLKSLQEEIENVSSDMNILAFFIKVSLKDYFSRKNGSVHISKNTNCGLYDPWSGAGSVLGVKLDRNIEIPRKNVFDYGIDGNLGYSVNRIYGASEDFWG